MQLVKRVNEKALSPVTGIGMIQNRRKFGRIDAQSEPCIVRMHGNETEAILMDESIGGLRVGGIALLHLFRDQEISVDYYDDTVFGRCRDVRRGEDGLFEIGILRDLDPDPAAPTTSLLNTFMDFDGRLIACVPMSIVEDDKIAVCLPGGREFTVPMSLVKPLTRQERQKQLSNLETRMKIGEAYNAIYGQATFNSLETILLHEYGPEIKGEPAE